MTVTITPAAPIVGTVNWVGTPVVSAPDSLGATASIANNVLTIHVAASDIAHVETISITGLKVKASSDATLGAVQATLGGDAAVYNAFIGGTTTANGHLAQAYGIGTTAFSVALDTGSCPFDNTGASTVTVGGTAITWATIAAGVLAGQWDFTTTLANAFATNHLANEVVTQTGVPACNTLVLGAPATVVKAAKVSYSGTPTVYPGESNGSAGDIWVSESGFGNSTTMSLAGGFLAKGTVITYTIATDGVVFSGTPSVSNFVYTNASNSTAADATLVLSGPILAADRKSVTVTVTTASTLAARVVLGNVRYDVASTVAGGTYVDVNATLSGGLLTTGNPAENAIVFRGITASAPTPTVYIGENNQATGLVTLTEAAAGFFQSGLGNNNIISVCTNNVDYSFTFPPYLKVTAGDLRLRDGSVASTTNIVAGTLNGTCYDWTVWTASTVASTVVIGNSTFASGPIINVQTDQAPGLVVLTVHSGNGGNFDDAVIANVGFAVAAFRNQVAVTALAQPLIPAGAMSKAGAIQIAETGIGQLKAGERICFEVLPRSSNDFIQDTFLMNGSWLHTAAMPIVTATGGLVVGSVSMSPYRCNGRQDGNTAPITFSGTNGISFSFDVIQQSTAGTGKMVVDNINLITTADAPNGPVLFNVFGYGQSNTDIDLQATVSNAKIGAKVRLSIGAVSALGNNPTSGYSTKTPKVQAAGKYITWKFTGGTALAGQRVNILVAKRINGAWGGPSYLKSVWADANGIVTFTWKAAAGTVLNVRAQWPGNTNYAVSTSKALGAHWQ
jgi:hypothetical protein